MLLRAVVRRSLCLEGISASTSSAWIPSRSLSTAFIRPSAVALGKRPMPPPSLSTSRTCNTSRHLSWIPWKTPASSPSPDDLLSSPTSSATFQHDPLVTSDHPDLPASPVAPSPSDSASSAPQPDTALATSAESTLDTTAISLPPLDPNASLGELISNSGRSLEDILNSPEAIHAAVSIPDLSLIGLDHRWFSFPGYAVDALVGLHNATGLPWWGTIALITILTRLFLSRLVISTQRHNVRYLAVLPQMTQLIQRVQQAQASGDQQAQMVLTQTLKNLLTEHDVSPVKPALVPMAQLPIFLSVFYALRRLSEAPLPQFKEGGFGWVTDLTLPDPYYILPISSMVLTNIMLRTGADGTGTLTSSGMAQHLPNVFGLLSVVLVPIIGTFPAALLFYWTFANACTLIQATLLRQPRIKRYLRIPTPVELPLPPGEAKPTRPTMVGSFKAIRDGIRDHYRSTMERAEKQTELAIANERQRGLRAGTANMITEKISENTDGASGRSALSSETSYLESPGQVPHRPGQQHRRPGNPAILKKPPPPPRRRSP